MRKPRNLDDMKNDAAHVMYQRFGVPTELVGWWDREKLKPMPGTYAIIGSYNVLLYVGQTKNLHQRFRKHHRQENFLAVLSNPEESDLCIWYYPLEEHSLLDAESAMLHAGHPPLNNTPLATHPVFLSAWVPQKLWDKLDAYARGLSDARGTRVDIPEAVAAILTSYLG